MHPPDPTQPPVPRALCPPQCPGSVPPSAQAPCPPVPRAVLTPPGPRAPYRVHCTCRPGEPVVPGGPPPEGGLAQRDGVPAPLLTPADDTPSTALTHLGRLPVLNVGLVTNITQVLLLTDSMDMSLSKLRRW